MKLKNLLIASCALLTTSHSVAIADNVTEGRFTCAALNVDGLPPNIKVLGIIDVTLNPDSKEGAGAAAIGTKAVEKGWDFFCVSEDFNYNTELMAPLSAAGYIAGTYRGMIVADGNAIGNFLANKPITETDGLNLIWKSGVKTQNETFIKWNTTHGYTDNGADGLINKGFRYYAVRIADGIVVDVYILHMDAEITKGDIEAREVQMKQMVDMIKASNNKRPIIVMGDTNCRYTRDHVKTLFIDAINSDPRFTIKDCWIETFKNGNYPVYGSDALMVGDLGYEQGEIVDKMFFINNSDSPIWLNLGEFKVDTDFKNEAGEPLADHYPVVGTFSYSINGETEKTYDFETLDNQGSTEYYIYNIGTHKFLNDDNTLTEEAKTLWTVSENNIKSADNKYIALTSASSCSSSASSSAISTIEQKYNSGEFYCIGNKLKSPNQTRFLEADGNGGITVSSSNYGKTVAEVANNGKWLFVSKTQYDQKNRIPTAITSTKANVSSDNIIYDITGRKMTSASKKGMYIKNGKKHIVK